MASGPISRDEKRQALERVTGSRTFARSDQLRSFLRYVCEAEFDGRAQQLNEYALGVAVLGRPADYSPAEDSCVRTRAYELRSKLKSYYQQEAPGDPIRIEIDKGAYVPRFERRGQTLPAERAEEPMAAGAATRAQPAPPRRRVSMAVVLPVTAIVVVSAQFHFLYRARRQPSPQATRDRGLTPELAALWKPFLDSDAPLLISYETRLAFSAPSTGLVVRDFRTNQVAEAAQSRPLAAFRARMGARDMQPTFDYADFGAVHAAFLLGRLLTPQRPDVGLKHAGNLGWEDIWNSNIIFIGKPNLNASIRHVLKGTDFADDELGLIRNLHPRPGESLEYRSATTHGSGEKYALITVMPGPQPGHHMMILGGSGSELMWALAECVTNRAHVKEIVARLCLPSGECPPAFQVVIQAAFESNVPIKIRYVTHRVSRAA
jgi:hypothetical protein